MEIYDISKKIVYRPRKWKMPPQYQVPMSEIGTTIHIKLERQHSALFADKTNTQRN